MISKLESGLHNIVDCGKKWLVDFNAEKAQLGFFDQSDHISAIDFKMDVSVLEKRLSYKILGLCQIQLRLLTFLYY